MGTERNTESSLLLPGRRDAASANNPLRRRWRLVKAAGVLGATIALAGLVAAAVVVSSIQREKAKPGIASPLQRLSKETDTVALGRTDIASSAEAEPESRDTLYTSTRVEGETEGDDKTGSSGPKAKIQSKPNVFFIMIDDMGWNDIGYQSTDLQGVTPNLDKLAAGGVKMTNYYSMQICTPARASLMTGRYVVRYGLQYGVIGCGAPYSLPFSEKIFPEYMKDAGYETHMIGKWHLGSYAQPAIPSHRGFDSFMGYLNGEEMYWTHQSLKAELFGRKFFDFGFGNSTGYYDIIDRPLPDHVQTGSLSSDDGDEGDSILSPTSTSSSSMSGNANGTLIGQYATQVFQDRAVAILKEKTPFDEEPLYMYLSHQAVHPPLGLPPAGCFSTEETAILERIKDNSDGDGHLRQRFAKVLMYLDRTIGDLVDHLEQEGWMENSIIVVASDNGGCYADGGSNYPLRGAKGNYWEGGNKVPALMYSTSHIPQERWGSEYDSMMHVTDWLPTIAAGAGIDLNGGAGPLDGINHWDYMMSSGQKAKSASPRQEMLYNLDPYTLWLNDDSNEIQPADFPFSTGAFRSGKYKLIKNEWCTGWYTFDKRLLARDPLTDPTSICNGHPCSSCGGEACGDHFDYLFDLETDPREVNNLIKVYPEIAESLHNRMVEVAFKEWTDSIYVGVDKQSYYVWAQYNWWMVPWWDLVQGADKGSVGMDGTSSSSSGSSTSDAAAY